MARPSSFLIRSLNSKFAAAVVSAALMLVVAATAYWSLSYLSLAQRWVAHTYEVIDQLRVCELHLREAEALQQNYLLDHDAAHAAEFQAERARAQECITSLRQSTSDNPRQAARLEKLAAAPERNVGVPRRGRAESRRRRSTRR